MLASWLSLPDPNHGTRFTWEGSSANWQKTNGSSVQQCPSGEGVSSWGHRPPQREWLLLHQDRPMLSDPQVDAPGCSEARSTSSVSYASTAFSATEAYTKEESSKEVASTSRSFRAKEASTSSRSAFSASRTTEDSAPSTSATQPVRPCLCRCAHANG